MRECFRQAIAGVYVKNWKSPTDLSTLDFEDIKKLLEEDVSTFKQRNPIGGLLVHVDEHRSSRLPERCHESTCRASWCPGLGNLH